ncbi:MAG TPA: AAA family ATPase [Methyloceanibacter sp.]|nr:AAA family ATPase [Methyloceanibacter sp.]
MDFLARRDAYDPRPATVERIETHISVVFLAGAFAYKAKRAVRYNFVDFSTLERRRIACVNELRVNARTAPQLYLQVLPVTVSDNGEIRLGGEGEAIEWVVKLRRFDQATLYDRMAQEGRLRLDAMPLLAETIAAFHASADRVLSADLTVAALDGVLSDNAAIFAANAQSIRPQASEALAAASRDSLARLAPLLEARARGGYVRHCHGDLHLRNIVDIEAAPVLFDAIEFDDRLATIDVLHDLAFLLMDLGKRGLKAYASAVLNAYLDADASSGNLLGLMALPLFLSMRAAVRAKVELLRAALAAPGPALATREEARAYFALAQNYLVLEPPRLIAIGGLSGSGKSAVARAVAPHIGAFPGAVIVRSDAERKRLFGAGPLERLPPAAYTQEVTERVYAMCRKRAFLALQGGQSVIVDAVHARADEREALAALAASCGAPFTGLWLEAPAQLLRDRIAARTKDVSDATPELVDVQLGYDLGRQDFAPVDASLPLVEVVAASLERLGARKPANP